MLLENGWLVDARHVPSPHHDCRPEDEKPTLLVVHNISLPPGEFGGPWIDALFTGTIDPDAHPFFAEIAHLRVSAHCLIRRDGEVVQYVPFDKRAWHAGVSMYHGRDFYRDRTGRHGYHALHRFTVSTASGSDPHAYRTLPGHRRQYYRAQRYRSGEKNRSRPGI